MPAELTRGANARRSMLADPAVLQMLDNAKNASLNKIKMEETTLLILKQEQEEIHQEERKRAEVQSAVVEAEESYRACIHAMEVQEAMIQQAFLTGQTIGSPLRAAQNVAASLEAAAAAEEREETGRDRSASPLGRRDRSESPLRRGDRSESPTDRFASQAEVERSRRRLAALSELDAVSGSEVPSAHDSRASDEEDEQKTLTSIFAKDDGAGQFHTEAVSKKDQKAAHNRWSKLRATHMENGDRKLPDVVNFFSTVTTLAKNLEAYDGGVGVCVCARAGVGVYLSVRPACEFIPCPSAPPPPSLPFPLPPLHPSPPHHTQTHTHAVSRNSLTGLLSVLENFRG